MSINKLALILYKIIDDCLRKPHRKWTLEDLIEKVSEGLCELKGIHSGVSKRTVQGDIQLMSSNKLGYNAPIVVTKRKYYTYSDLSYSISNSPLSDSDMSKMRDAVDILKHLNGFAYFDEMSDMIARLENNLSKRDHTSVSYIQLENNKLLKGLNWITPLYRAIRENIPLLISYKSFKSQAPQDTVYFPYLLKEYRNRWFLICRPKKGKTLVTLALDRIEDIAEMAKSGYVEYDGVDFERYYADTIGVTKSERDRGHRVILRVDQGNAPYVLTKPLHASQQLLKTEEDGGILIRMDVVLNFELERELIGFGECIEVLAPKILRDRIKRREPIRCCSSTPSNSSRTA
ncbi:WYL domain-containing protein [Sphingobacterium alkalisoli]|uniref:WYL domain-containing protein n=1 Tax=Sphingobacterium alkalisoli TaxID=1874115 RepID=A0A4U0H1H7_9SPHI|nr:WYL domain-containing protein [Sphingobacterium alkalisoli]TJY65413.1 WYL domain-containing protein [Sphingobacterium alkalisoli]GGH20614.1 WYL domain-containing protein [Sphingobacterium alkalisoli]